MSNILKLKTSGVASAVPEVGDLQYGELAVNHYDGLLFFKKNDGSDSIVTINPDDITGIDTLAGLTDVVITSATAGQVLQYNGSSFVNEDNSVLVTNRHVAADETAHLALVANEGDLVIRTDESKTYAHNGGSAGTMADYTELLHPDDVITSVNGATGTVVLDADDLDDAATVNKFASEAQLDKVDYITVTSAVDLDDALLNTDTLDGGTY